MLLSSFDLSYLEPQKKLEEDSRCCVGAGNEARKRIRIYAFRMSTDRSAQSPSSTRKATHGRVRAKLVYFHKSLAKIEVRRIYWQCQEIAWTGCNGQSSRWYNLADLAKEDGAGWENEEESRSESRGGSGDGGFLSSSTRSCNGNRVTLFIPSLPWLVHRLLARPIGQ